MEKLSTQFVNKYINKQPSWGFNGLGYIVFKRSYARRIGERTEEWFETVERAVNGAQDIGANYTKEEMERLYDHVFNLRCNFAGRALWQLGTGTVKKIGANSLINCFYTDITKIEDFLFIFENLMLGGGLGYSVRKEHAYALPVIKENVIISHENTKDADFIVPDSREGWIALLDKVLKSYFYSGKSFTYSTILVRGRGELIKTFGGVSSGPQILVDGISGICGILDSRVGKKLRSVDVLDICNLISQIVISGNVRRSAAIALGDSDDTLFLKAKRWDTGKIPNWRAMSNNTVECNDIEDLQPLFWEGYKGNGEPYGLFNLKLAKKYGRIGEEHFDSTGNGLNPCGEIVALADKETCVRGDTPIITREGITYISDSIGKNIEVWNGKKWSNVVPIKTGENQKMFRVYFGDGSYLDCTENHRFSVKDRFQKEWKEVSLKNLKDFSKYKLQVEPTSIEYNDGKSFDMSYELGAAVGDGVVDWYNKKVMIDLFSPKSEVMPIRGIKYKERNIIGHNYPLRRIRVDLDMDFVNGLKNNPKYIEMLFKFDRDSILKFFAGLADTDGSYGGKGGIRIYISDYERARMFQLLLTKAGIKSSVNFCSPKGLETSYGIRKKDLYYLQITDCKDIPCYRLDTSNGHNPKFKGKYQIIKDIVELDGLYDSFCFEEKENHKAVFSNVLTYQCNLSELYMNNISNKEEMLDCAKLLYKYQKAVCNMEYINKETTDIVHKNNRIGVGVTGVLQNKKALDENWYNYVYKELRKFDKQWSKEREWNESIRLTTIKPSGSLSLLAGSTPGIHPAYSKYYIRRVEMSSNDPLVEYCRNLGLNVVYRKQFDGTDDRLTVKVEFPCYVGENTPTSDKLSGVELLEYVKKMQKIWADNAVSVTCYYKKEELNDIQEWLKENYDNNIKTVSFLLHSDHGFVQPPYEPIMKEKYEELKSNIKDIKAINEDTTVVDVDSDCDSGGCPIR